MVSIKSDNEKKRKNRTICLPFDKAVYEKIIHDPHEFRKALNNFIAAFPELFPCAINNKGYVMKDIYPSRKLLMPIRRIEVDGISYTIRPSFVTPYMTGFTEDIEKALFLRKFGVPFWALSYVFGKDSSYWFRIEQTIGRNSIVGTTARFTENLPQHLAADEKHTRMKGDKVYIATVVGKECILGVSVTNNAGEDSLVEAYGVFKDEIQCTHPEYKPLTVNTDGWKATQKAWLFLFPTIVIICCFLHVFIKMRDRAKKKFREIFNSVATQLWHCYQADTKRSFSQRIRRLKDRCKDLPNCISDPIKKMQKNIGSYSKAYDFPGSHRTSNMLDRLMQRMDLHLFKTQYFHGDIESSQLSIRGWALIQNFAPSNPTTVRKYKGMQSPSERLNKFAYHQNWMQNLLVSASLGGYKHPPQNP